MPTAGVVAFAFGTPWTIRSNVRISAITSEFARIMQAPVYSQTEIRADLDIALTRIEEIPGSPPPTLRIARGAVQWASQLHIQELWIVAAEPHLFRCSRDLEAAVLESGASIEVHICESIWRYRRDEWFCQDSEQSRTRSRVEWNMREKVLLALPRSLYKIVAG